MDGAGIASLRLRNQRLLSAPTQTPAELVSQMGAIQGQDYAGALWALGLRIPGATHASIERALELGEVLRTWAMHGTLHLVAARDMRWLLTLVAPKVLTGNRRRYAELELGEQTSPRATNSSRRCSRSMGPSPAGRCSLPWNAMAYPPRVSAHRTSCSAPAWNRSPAKA